MPGKRSEEGIALRLLRRSEINGGLRHPDDIGIDQHVVVSREVLVQHGGSGLATRLLVRSPTRINELGWISTQLCGRRVQELIAAQCRIHTETMGNQGNIESAVWRRRNSRAV